MMLRMSRLGSGFSLRKFDVFVLNYLLKFCARLLRLGIYAGQGYSVRVAKTYGYQSNHVG